ncbi:type I secretion C-terminal target domain-containing protein, partial [Halomonas campisalis]
DPVQGPNTFEKPDITVEVVDTLGQSASDDIQIEVIDDVPELTSLQNIVIAAGETGVAEGQLVFNAGADGLSKFTIGGEQPTGYLYDVYHSEDGIPDSLVGKFEFGSGQVLLVATSDNAEDEIFFTLYIREDGSYQFELVSPLGETIFADFANLDSGNFDEVGYSDATGKWTFDRGQTKLDSDSDVFVKANGDINPSGAGIGVGNNHYNAGDVVYLDFTNPTSFFSMVTSRTSGSDTQLVVKWTAELVGGGEFSSYVLLDGSSQPFVFQHPDGLEFEKLTLEAMPSNYAPVNVDNADGTFSSSTGAQFTLDQLVFGGGFNVEGLDLSFDVSAVDGDGDVAESLGLELTLAGNDGSPGYLLTGGEEDDVLVGSSGNDILIGGAGDDILYGGAGADTFQWDFGSNNDQGTSSDPAKDWVMDFDSSEGDSLKFTDLFSSGNEEPLDYLFAAEDDGGNTILYISTAGEMDGVTNWQDALDKADQVITLNDYSMNGQSSEDFIEHLINNNHLNIDQ